MKKRIFLTLLALTLFTNFIFATSDDYTTEEGYYVDLIKEKFSNIWDVGESDILYHEFIDLNDDKKIELFTIELNSLLEYSVNIYEYFKESEDIEVKNVLTLNLTEPDYQNRWFREAIGIIELDNKKYIYSAKITVEGHTKVEDYTLYNKVNDVEWGIADKLSRQIEYMDSGMEAISFEEKTRLVDGEVQIINQEEFSKTYSSWTNDTKSKYMEIYHYHGENPRIEQYFEDKEHDYYVNLVKDLSIKNMPESLENIYNKLDVEDEIKILEFLNSNNTLTKIDIDNITDDDLEDYLTYNYVYLDGDRLSDYPDVEYIDETSYINIPKEYISNKTKQSFGKEILPSNEKLINDDTYKLKYSFDGEYPDYKWQISSMYGLGNQRYYLLLNEYMVDGLLTEWSGGTEVDIEFMKANGYDYNDDDGVYQIEMELFSIPMRTWKGEPKFFENRPGLTYAIVDLSGDNYNLIRSGPMTEILSNEQLAEYIEEEVIEYIEEDIIEETEENPEMEQAIEEVEKPSINKKMAILLGSISILAIGFIYNKFR